MASIALHKLDLSFLRKDGDSKPERGRFRWSDVAQKMVTLEEWHRLHPHPARGKDSDLARPMVIGTFAEPIKSMIDGQYYDSKATYYRHVERNGCSIVGFDKNWEEQIKPVYDERKHEADVVADVKKAIEQVNSHGGVPGG